MKPLMKPLSTARYSPVTLPSFISGSSHSLSLQLPKGIPSGSYYSRQNPSSLAD